jgi:hypothetical protein
MADLSVKKLRAAALRDKECAIAMSQAGADFPSVSSGLTAGVVSEIDGCF